VDVLVSQPAAFLGEVRCPVRELMSAVDQRNPKRLERPLEATTNKRGKLYFEVCFVPYQAPGQHHGEREWQSSRAIQNDHNDRSRHMMDSQGMSSLQRGNSHNSHYRESPGTNPGLFRSGSNQISNAGSGIIGPETGQGVGQLQVEVLAAYNLEDKAVASFVDGKSDPYVKVRLKHIGHDGKKVESKSQRTRTVMDDCNPKWNHPDDRPFIFEVVELEGEVVCEVFSQASLMQKLGGDPPLGKMIIPIQQIVQNYGQTMKIRDRLTDAQSGELEVAIGFNFNR
jgi:hypothetical protein